jgi:hypothetical protein
VAISLLGVVAKVVGFIRAGYPEGAPPTGYVPLLALLRRRLSDDEVSAVAAELAARGDALIDGIDIGAVPIDGFRPANIGDFVKCIAVYWLPASERWIASSNGCP